MKRHEHLMYRLLILTVALAVALAACGADVGEPPGSSTPATTPTSTTSVPRSSTTNSPPTTHPQPPAEEAAVAEWLVLVSEGDLEAAWDTLAESSQRAIGSKELFLSFATELEEGWGAWASAPDLELSVGDARPHPLGTLTEVSMEATVTQEGMAEQRVAVMKVVTSDGVARVSPFEEFGELADRVLDDDRPPVPADSGAGRRIVYDNSDQRVWLVEEDGSVVDTYLVSGRQGVPAPGTYRVFSKSETAWAGHDGITMRYMVRFTRAESGLAIGFHSIPYWGSGEPMQSEDELGEFRSAGCVRQSLGKAADLYAWADVDTVVVVLA